MAFIYCKYRIDFDNTVTGLSPVPQTLEFNEFESYVFSGRTFTGETFNYRFDGTNIIDNTPAMKANYIAYLTINDSFYSSYIPTGNTRALIYSLSDTVNAISKKALITGLYHGGRLSINPFSNTKFDINNGNGFIKDSFNVNTPLTKYVYWNDLTGITPTFLLTKPVTHVSIDSGGTVIQSFQEPNLLQLKNQIYLGVIVHTQNTTISSTATRPVLGKNIGLQFNDYISSFGLLNLGENSNKISPYTGLTISRNEGSLLGRGINYDADERVPHALTLSGETPLQFRYRTITGTNTPRITSIDPTTYEPISGSVVTITGNTNQATTQRIYLFASGGIAIQRGQHIYASILDAYTSLSSEIFVVNQDIIDDGILIGAIVVRKGATDLTNSNDAIFVKADSFGNLADTIERSIYNKIVANIALYTGTTAPATFLTKTSFNLYTGTTEPATYLKIANFNIYSGVTLTNINSRLLKTDFNSFTGITAPNTYQSKSSIVVLTGTTLPATYQSKSSINTYTGTTAPNQFASRTNFNTFTGTTAPATYQSKSSIVTLTGTTLPLTYQSKSSIVVLTGTTLPATYLSISSFNPYSASTLTNINSRLLTSAFNIYSGNTANLINTKIDSANNGLTKAGTRVHLGGNLTGATSIGLSSFNLIFTGTTGTLRYGSDMSAQYNIRSFVDKGYVTGITSTLLTISAFNVYSGATLTNINSRLLTTAFNTYSGNTANLINTKISTANNGLTKAGTNVHLGGALTGATQIGLGANNLTFTASTGTLRYGSDLSAQYNVRSLVDKGYVTGITNTLLSISSFNVYSASTLTNINSRLLISAFNTYSGNTANLINTKVDAANNGLTKAGTRIHLGGTLTGATSIGLSSFNLTFTGTTGTLRYGSDLSTQYNVRSFVDKGYVTGITNTLLTISSFNTYSGNTANLINTKLNTSAFNTYSGNTAVILNTKIDSANNGLTKVGRNVRLGGNLTGATTIGLTANNLTFTATTGTLRYGTDLSGQYNVRSLVDKGYVTGITSTLLSISAFNTYSGNSVTYANNGLTRSGANVHLGGSLTGATTIDATSFGFTLTGTSGQFLGARTTGSVNLQSRNSVLLIGKSVAGVDRVTLKVSATGATFTDARTGTTASGLQYAADYSVNYVKRSVIDQAYYTGHTLYTRSQLLVYASGSTDISVATPVSLIMNRLIRNDSAVFTYTGGTTIKILQAGTYDVSYTINTTNSNGILKSVAANLYKNGVSLTETTTSGTLGGQAGAGCNLTLSPTQITFAANDVIQLRGFRLIVPLSGTAPTTANAVFLSIVKKY